MANNAKIRGITVEIGGDASGLNKALKDVNSTVKDTQKQLSDVQRLLKLDPGNTELLRQKQKLLGDQVANTKDKLAELHKIEQQLKDSGVEENSAQFMALRREIIDTEDSLDNLEKAAKKSNVALEKIGATADKVAAGAGKVADATRGISGAAAAGLGGIVAAGVSAVKASDDLNTLAKQTGLSTETLQQAQYAADLIDVSYETFSGSLTKMVGKLRTNEEGFKELGIATRDAAGNLLGTEEIFWNSVDALSAIQNETERDVAAQELFGKSAADLAGIIDDGGAAFKRLGKEAKNAGLIMDQDTLDGLNAVNDQLDSLKAKAKGTLSVSGAKAIEALAPVIEDVVEKIDKLLTRLGNLDESQIKTIMAILAVVAAISPVASIVEKTASAVSTLTTVLSGLSAPVAIVLALVAAIALFGDQIQTVLQQVDDFLQGVFARDWTEVFGPVLGEALNGFFANIKNVWDAIKTVLDGIIDFIRGVFTADWKRAWEGVKEIFGGIFKGLLTIVKAPLNGIITLLNGIINGINAVIRGLNKLPNVNIGEIGKIPYLASGGILSRGSAIVGEAGPELLTMAGGRAIVQPLGYAGANLSNVEGLLGQINGNISGHSFGPQTIIVQSVLDGRVIGQTAYQYSQDYARRQG